MKLKSTNRNMLIKPKKKKKETYGNRGPHNRTIVGSHGVLNNSVIDGFIGSH